MTTYLLNNELNGIEIYFSEKPPAGIIQELKNTGWRWHNGKKCWYAKQCEKTLVTAKIMANITTDALTDTELLPNNEPTPPVNIHGVKVGDIFYTSWGWEQTNVDFFQVVAVTAKMATVKPIACRRTGTAYLQGNAEPSPDEFITDSNFYKPITKTRTEFGYSGEPALVNADGREHRGFLYKASPISYSEYA